MATVAPERLPETAPARGFHAHRVTLERYQHMIDAGVYNEKDPVFLWKGQLVEKMTKGPYHNFTMKQLNVILLRLLPAGWHHGVEQPVVLHDDSVPEPDFSIIRGESSDYLTRPVRPSDVGLIIEVSDSSLSVDSGEVLTAYALNAFPCYWIVSVPDRQVLVHTKPEGGRYAVKESFGIDGLVPVILDGREVGRVAVKDVLP